MAAMRRRRAPGDAGGGGLDEALLPQGEEASDQQGRQAQAHGQAPRHQQLIVHSPFDLDAFLRFVWERWTALLRAIAACLRALLGQGRTQLSLVQASRLEELQARVGVAYDPSDALHREGLQELWGLAFPGKPCPGMKDEQWKDMGWQNADPTSDFRAAGILGLDNLLYLGREHPALFRDLRSKARGARSSWEYPFGAAGMNVTWTLVELLQLKPQDAGDDAGGAAASTAEGRGFIGLLSAEAAAFEEVYCATFDLLDRVWLERGATYMEFNSILKDVRERVRRALAGGPRDAAALRAALGLPPLAR